MPVTGKLVSWSRFTSDTWPTLLLGNGFSMNLWDGFSYKSLFDNAFFTPPADALFAELDTTNFEQVLECIHHAKLTEDATTPREKLDRLYTFVSREIRYQIEYESIIAGWQPHPSATVL